MKEIINSSKLPSIGPYSHAVQVQGEFVFLSGQLGIDHRTKEMGKNIEEQTTFSLENIEILLQELNLTVENVVKTTVLLKDINDFQKMNHIYGNVFNTNPPARTAFQVAALPNDGLVEIEVIAVK